MIKWLIENNIRLHKKVKKSIVNIEVIVKVIMMLRLEDKWDYSFSKKCLPYIDDFLYALFTDLCHQNKFDK